MNYIDPTSPRSRAAPLPAVALSDIAEIGWRFRWGAILIVAATIVCSIAYTTLIRGDSFVAEAKLLVRLGQEQAPAPTMIADRSLLFGNQVAITSSEIELLRSRDLIAKLVDRIDFSEQPRPPATSLIGKFKDQVGTLWHDLHDELDTALIAAGLKLPLTPREQAMEAISQSLLVDTPPGGNVVTVRLIWPERGTAEAILQQLLTLYFEQRANLFQGSTASRFFSDRLAEAAAHLKTAEAALADFERAHQITNPDEQRNGLLKRLNDADIGVDAATLETAAAETSLRQLQATPSGEAAAGGSLPDLGFAQNGSSLQQSMSSELAAAVARLAATQTNSGSQDPSVRHQQSEVATRSRLLRQQTAATASQRRELLVRRTAQRDAIRVELAGLQAAMEPWQDLKREVASALRAYEFNDGKLNEAAGIAALEAARIGNVSIVEHPMELALPVGVRKSSLLMLAAAAGLMVALAYIVLRAFFDHRLHRLADLEQRLGLRALAAIPEDRRGLAAGRPAAATDQAMARAAAGLARSLTGTSFQALAVIGVARGEGATTTTLHLGRHMAELLGLRVLLADMGAPASRRSPDLMTRAAALPHPPQTLDRAALACEAATLPAWAIVDLRGGGDTALVQLRQVIQAARSSYDFLLIDTPAYQDSVDTLLASRQCGQTLLVARADNLTWQAFQQMQGDLAEEAVQLAGAVLNRARARLPRWLVESLR